MVLLNQPKGSFSSRHKSTGFVNKSFILDSELMIYADPVPVDLCLFQDRIPRRNYKRFNSFVDNASSSR